MTGSYNINLVHSVRMLIAETEREREREREEDALVYYLFYYSVNLHIRYNAVTGYIQPLPHKHMYTQTFRQPGELPKS